MAHRRKIFVVAFLFLVSKSFIFKIEAYEMEDKKTTKFVSGISELINEYDVFIVDIWGVLHDGVKPYENVKKCLDNIQKSKIKIIFLSNTPRPSETIISSLEKMDIFLKTDQLLTSGDIIRSMISDKNVYPFDIKNLKLFHLGSDRNQDILKNMDVNIVEDCKDANLMLLSSYRDEDEDFSEIISKLKEAKNYTLPVVCANPDVTVFHGLKRRFCAGYFAAEYEKIGGKVFYFGKPHSLVYEYISSLLFKEGFIDNKKFLMIGDTLETDIKGASDFGIDTLQVLTGNGSSVLKNLEKQLIKPKLIMESFQW